MAKRQPPRSESATGPTPGADVAAGGCVRQPRRDEVHVVVFRLGEQSFGFRLQDVSEIVRPPALAQMPLGPRSLLGLANLRGVVLPVVGLRRLLGLPDCAADEATRVIVIDRGAPVGFWVDRIERLLVVPARRSTTTRRAPARSIQHCCMA